MGENAPSGQERTESPTSRRREKARQEGKVARSKEISGAVVLLGGTGTLVVFGGEAIGRYLVGLLRECGASLSTASREPFEMVGMIHRAGVGFLGVVVPILTALGVVVLLVNLAQTRGLVSWKPIEPMPSRLNPIAGLRRLVGTEAIAKLVGSVAKMASLGLVTYLVISRSWPDLVVLSTVDPAGIVTVIGRCMLRLALLTGLCFLLISVADYAYQRHKTEKSLRMTKEEVAREQKETEGNPLVRRRIQTLMRAQARRRMLQDVPRADVVVVNPTSVAVALRYAPEEAPAPLVLAMGQRKLAQRIRWIAIDARVPIVENQLVARALLATGKVGRPIPPALYVAVAEILAYVYRKRDQLRRLDSRLLPGRPA